MKEKQFTRILYVLLFYHDNVISAINCTQAPFEIPNNGLAVVNWTETEGNPRPYATLIKYEENHFTNLQSSTKYKMLIYFYRSIKCCLFHIKAVGKNKTWGEKRGFIILFPIENFRLTLMFFPIL